MAEIKSIPLAKIMVPERLRAVEEDHALAISASIVEHGLINPITVRHTPRRSDTPYTLVAGAHRLRAIALLDERDVDCIVVEGDADEAQLIEITENLFRNDLSVLDRAIFVVTYREVWERKYGKIEAGRPAGNNRVNLIQLIGDEASTGFASYAASRIGASPASVKRLTYVAQNIPANLRAKLRGTAVADHQAQLLAIAKLPTSKKSELLAAIELLDGDVDRALAAIGDQSEAKSNRDDKTYDTLVSTWGRTNARVRQRFVDGLSADEQMALYELLRLRLVDQP